MGRAFQAEELLEQRLQGWSIPGVCEPEASVLESRVSMGPSDRRSSNHGSMWDP